MGDNSRSRRIGFGMQLNNMEYTWMEKKGYGKIALGIDIQVDIQHYHFAVGVSVVVFFMK